MIAQLNVKRPHRNHFFRFKINSFDWLVYWKINLALFSIACVATMKIETQLFFLFFYFCTHCIIRTHSITTMCLCVCLCLCLRFLCFWLKMNFQVKDFIFFFLTGRHEMHSRYLPFIYISRRVGWWKCY